MKVNNLLKKVGSVITTAALLATLGTTAFADGENVSTKPGKGISITSVTTTKVDDNGLYNVKVEYATTVDNVTGMTMLAYRAKDSSGNPSDTALGTAYSNDMQIVGIDQKEPVKNNSGSFEFKVTTNTDANGFYIQKGKKALIAVSGDQCEPAYATLLIKLAAKEITPKTLDKAVSVAANASDVDIQSALNTAAEKATVSVIDDVDGEHQVSLSLADIKDGKWALGEDGKYTKTYTFKASNTYVEGVEFKEDKTVKVTATITKTAVDATAVDTFNGKSAENDKFIIEVQKSDLDSQTGDKGDYLRNQILNKKVKFKAEETGKTTLYGEILVADSMVSAKQEYAEGTNTYDYTVTVPEGQITDSYVIVPEALKTFTVSVSVTEKPAITAITPTSAINNSDYSFAVSDTDAFTAENIAAKLKNDRAGDSTAVKYTVGTEQKDATLEDFVYGWDVTITGDTAEAKLKITGIKTESISNQYSLNLTDNVLATVKVTKEEGTPIKLGDVNFDNKITGADLNMMKAFLAGQLPKDGQVSKDLHDASSVRYNAANINRDTKFNGADLNRYKAHLAGQLTDENIGQIIVGHISTK